MINCFVAAICRAISEGKDDSTYFGSTAQLEWYREEAKRLGLLADDRSLTEAGLIVGRACQHLPDGRAYAFYRQYEDAALAAFSA
jgi:hypothetical protein